jgi:hypothetical protein
MRGADNREGCHSIYSDIELVRQLRTHGVTRFQSIAQSELNSSHHACPRYSWMDWIAMLPAPTAEATRLIERWRTSPTAKTPGILVSNGNGARASSQVSGRCPSFVRSVPVRIKPCLSRKIVGGSQLVWGCTPIWLTPPFVFSGSPLRVERAA